MANMSYCRFENTLNDLEDCAEHLHEPESKTEIACRDKMVETCRCIVDDWDESVEEDDDDDEDDDLDEEDEESADGSSLEVS
jgi:ferredoxin